MTHLEREIHSQPEVVGRLLKRESLRVRQIAGELARSQLKTILVVARGSSDNAGVYGKYLFGSRNRLVVALAAPSLFTLYRSPPNLSGCLILAISQSGASYDIQQVVAEGRRQGARTLVVTNVVSGALSREADYVVLLHAGKERSVAATKTYTAELMALAMLSAALRKNPREWEALERVPEFMQNILEGADVVSAAAERYRYVERMSVISRGYNYATAFELSLKLKELAYIAAEPSSSADFRHGPIAMVGEGFPVVLVAPKGRTLTDMHGLAQSLRARRAELVVISDSRRLLSLASTSLPLRPGLPEWLSPLATVIPGQLFAMGLAAVRGCPLDRPRGLSKLTRTT